MTQLTCLIVDDEPLALDILQEYVKRTSFLQLAGRCSDVFDAQRLIQNSTIDLIFLDIEMPDMNGMEFAKTLSNGPKIIFTTAYPNFAIQGYKVDALDYLLKPFSYDEFFAAAQKGLNKLSTTPSPTSERPTYIYVKSEYKHVKIVLSDILFIEGLKDYVKIYLKGQGKPILSLLSLKSLEEQLPDDSFMRLHRSFIVNLDKIEMVEKGQVVVNGTSITVADNYKERFQRYLNSNSI